MRFVCSDHRRSLAGRFCIVLLAALIASPAVIAMGSDPLALDFEASPAAYQPDAGSAAPAPSGPATRPSRTARKQNRLRPPSSPDVEPPADGPAYYDPADAPRVANRQAKTQYPPDNGEYEQRSQPGANYAQEPPASAAVQPAVLPGSSAVAEGEFDPPSNATEPRQAESANNPLPLSPRRSTAGAGKNVGGQTRLSSKIMPGIGSTGGTIAASLALVLGLFFLFAWLMRRNMPNTAGLLPKTVLEVLGRLPMPGRQQMQLIRCGNKLLLVHLSLTGAETLTEITEPEEVDRIAGLCLQGSSKSSTRDFNELLTELGRSSPSRLAEQDYGLELHGGRQQRGRGRRSLDG